MTVSALAVFIAHDTGAVSNVTLALAHILQLPRREVRLSVLQNRTAAQRTLALWQMRQAFDGYDAG